MNHGKQSLAIGALTVFLALSATSDCTAEEYWPLSKLIKFSQEHNPDSAAARERIAAAAASVKQAESAYYPQLQMQSAYTRTNQPVSVFASALTQRAYAPTLDFNDVPDTDDLSVRGTLQYVAYSGGRDSAEKAAAKAIASAATFSHQAIQNELAYQVTRSYITLAKAREFIRATEAAVRAFEGNLGTARTKEQEGSLLRSDVLDLEVRLAQAREELVRAKNANALAAEALINLLG